MSDPLVSLIDAVFEAVDAWSNFKDTHDITALKMNCCENSARLYKAMDLLESQFNQKQKMKEIK